MKCEVRVYFTSTSFILSKPFGIYSSFDFTRYSWRWPYLQSRVHPLRNFLLFQSTRIVVIRFSCPYLIVILESCTGSVFRLFNQYFLSGEWSWENVVVELSYRISFSLYLCTKDTSSLPIPPTSLPLPPWGRLLSRVIAKKKVNLASLINLIIPKFSIINNL